MIIGFDFVSIQCCVKFMLFVKIYSLMSRSFLHQLFGCSEREGIRAANKMIILGYGNLVIALRQIEESKEKSTYERQTNCSKK
jgi:hypothetical protein